MEDKVCRVASRPVVRNAGMLNEYVQMYDPPCLKEKCAMWRLTGTSKDGRCGLIK